MRRSHSHNPESIFFFRVSIFLLAASLVGLRIFLTLRAMRAFRSRNSGGAYRARKNATRLPPSMSFELRRNCGGDPLQISVAEHTRVGRRDRKSTRLNSSH